MKLPIYMDNQATTPLDPRVLAAMMPYFVEKYGNAASRSHSLGWDAEAAVNRAREQIAALLGGSSKEIVFTSGATESDNLAIKGASLFRREQGRHIITSQTEHKAVLDSCRRLEREGFRVTCLPVARDGRVTPESVAEAIEQDTVLVSIMLANNEIGVINPIPEIAAAIKAKREAIVFHVDAVQGIGKIPFNVKETAVDLVSVSAHKMYGPKGIGALWVRRKPRVRLDPIIDGGGHEQGMRSGTLNVPGIVGLGAACEIAAAEMADEARTIGRLRDKLLAGITARLSETHINGSLEHRIPGNLNISFAFVEGEALMMALKDVAVSSGSACTSASLEPSYVLRALGVAEELAHTSIRFGLGRFNTEEEVDYVVDLVVEKVGKLREMSPLWEMHQEGVDLQSVKWAVH
ncbi:MAG: IscS subfamily cysteine desulfurase [Pseudomonadota bacterium]